MTESTEANYEDEAVSDAWCAEMRLEVEQYLKSEEYECGDVNELPAWHIAPYVSVWEVESATEPGFVGAWVVCGDLPTDLVDGADIHHPREVLAVIAERWQAYVDNERAGTPNEDMAVESGDSPEEMIELLESRAAVLREWAADDEMWGEEDGDEDAGDE